MSIPTLPRPGGIPSELETAPDRTPAAGIPTVSGQLGVRRPDVDVVIIGAGPYGLSVAAHLSAAGVSVQVLGRPMSYWRDHMPRGMLLRSSWEASHIADPGRAHTLDAYERQLATAIGRPIPLDRFVDYGLWFAGRLVPGIDTSMATRVERDGLGFRVVLENGDALQAGRVVVATGLDGFAHIPVVFASISPEQVIHASDLVDPNRLSGRQVAVIGGGQSALETAALIHEAGAAVRVLTRASRLRWLRRSQRLHGQQGLARRLLYPPTDVGPPGLNQIVARPPLWRQLPGPLGARVAYRCIRPAGAGWLVERLAGVPLETGRTVESAEERPDGLRLVLEDGSHLDVEHVVLATGYRVDVGRLPFLGPELLSRLRRPTGYPHLRGGFESSVPGLHFVGAASALSWGPVMRFVSGTTFTARALTEAVIRSGIPAAR